MAVWRFCTAVGAWQNPDRRRIHKGIVARDRIFEIVGRHRHALVLHLYLLREIRNAACGKEKSRIKIHIRRRRLPFLALDRVRVEDRPDRAAAIMAVADSRHRRESNLRVIFHVARVAIAVREIGADGVVALAG